MCDAELIRFPSNVALKAEGAALETIRTSVRDHWPLTAEEKARVNIGVYAIRELEGINEDLVAKLATLEQQIKSALA